MKYAVLGTGMVGQTLGAKLIALGHHVMMGSRTADNEKALKFASDTGGKAGTFAEATAFGEHIILAVSGAVAKEVLEMAGADNLKGKIVIDVSNPLDFSNGFPPVLVNDLANTTSVGETLQATFPTARIVKTLNTVNCGIMVAPDKLSEPTGIFVSGNDASAKTEVSALLNSFGWQNPIDLGDITTARGTEQYLPLWVRLMKALGTADFNIKLVR